MPHSSKQTTGRHLPTKAKGVTKSVSPRTGKVTWEARYRNAEGKYVYETCPTFEDAKARHAELTNRIYKGEVIASANTTFGDILPGWREQRDVIGVKPRTREGEERNIRLYIAPRWSRVKVRDISANDITTWVNGLKRQDGEAMNSGTKALILAQMSSVLNYAVTGGLISSNPVRAMDRKAKPRQDKKVPRILRPGELAALVAGVGRQFWLGPILRVTTITGMRLGEVVGLQWGDIDFDAGTIRVERQLGKTGMGTPKGNKSRTIPMLGDARSILLAQHAETARARLAAGLGAITDETPVFSNSLGGHRQPRDVERALGWARERAGLSEEPRALTLHDLRHTVATALANEPGAVLPQVMAYLGHSSLDITMQYVHETQNERWQESAGAALAGLGA